MARTFEPRPGTGGCDPDMAREGGGVEGLLALSSRRLITECAQSEILYITAAVPSSAAPHST